jgi:pimeloyl-ACP methyl ester carboxylesterase
VRVEVEPGICLNVRHREGAGRPYLFVHGLSSNARLWDGVAEHLPNPSWAVDLRSHGESDAPENGYDTATAAADLVAVIAKLELDRPVVVGQSWGGNIVVQLAAKHPELVSGIGLVDGGWIELSTAFSSWEECERALRPSEIDGLPASQLRTWMAKAHRDWSEAALQATMANMRLRPDGTIERRLPIDKHMLIVRSMWDEPPAQFLPLITAPVLLLPAIGPQDKKASRITSAAELIRKSSIVWYPNSDHDLHAQHPARLAADLATLAGGS